jgi:hypothetical protein
MPFNWHKAAIFAATARRSATQQYQEILLSAMRELSRLVGDIDLYAFAPSGEEFLKDRSWSSLADRLAVQANDRQQAVRRAGKE